MAKKENIQDGSEIHRLKPMKEYDPKVFNHMYKLVKPVVAKLVMTIDVKRFNISRDILRDQFYDKMLYVFNKYYGEVNEEHLKANILRALYTYKNHLLKYAYNDRAVFNQSLRSMEDLFDNDKELLDINYTEDSRFEKLDIFMKNHLSLDAQLIWEVLMVNPPYIELHKTANRVTNTLLAEFFNLPTNRNSIRYIGELREDIQYWLEKFSTSQL